MVATGEVGLYLMGQLLRRQIFSLPADELHDPEDSQNALEFGGGLGLTGRKVARVSTRVARLNQLIITLTPIPFPDGESRFPDPILEHRLPGARPFFDSSVDFRTLLEKMPFDTCGLRDRFIIMVAVD